MSRWQPLGANSAHNQRPHVGDVVAVAGGAWRVTGIGDASVLDDADRDIWQQQGIPDLDTWRQRPYWVRALHLGGVAPENMRPGRECLMSVSAGRFITWHVYPHGRWPQCSCCGDPMPCRAALADLAVAAAESQMEKFEARMPGCCWACNEPISQRQRAVTYPGPNLDLPTTPGASFHRRRSCLRAAMQYEERWLRDDSNRPRVLTYPDCPGQLIIHGDGATECHGGLDGCHGHSTHDHRHLSSCYLQSHGCGRECPRAGHPGCRPAPRPPRRSEQLS